MTDRYSPEEREHIEELASAYSLGALTDETDLLEFERLVESGDPQLSKNLENLLQASTALALAAPVVEPPAGLRASILEAISKAPPPERIQIKPEESIDAIRLRKRTRLFIGTGIVAGLLICYILALNVTSTAKLDRSNDLMKALLKQTDSLRNAITLMNDANPKPDNTIPSKPDEITAATPFFSMFSDADVHLVTLASLPAGVSRQHLLFSPKKKLVYFVYDKHHPLDENKTYELSASRLGKPPVTIGTFRVDPKKDPPLYAFAANFDHAESFSISTGPEHKILFTGDLEKN